MTGTTQVEACARSCPQHQGFIPTILVCLLLFAGISQGLAQQPSPNPLTPSPPEVLQALKDSLFDLNQEIGLLQHFLEAATVDKRSLWSANLRSWRLNNPALRDSLFSALIEADSSVQAEAGAEAILLGTLNDDLVEARFGNAVFKGVALEEAISRSGDRNLYRKIASSYRYSPDIELRDPDVKLTTPFFPQLMEIGTLTPAFSPNPIQSGRTPHDIAAEISLSGISVRGSGHWGGEFHLGFEEAALPFWLAGTFQLLASYDQIKFGVALPLLGGRFVSQQFRPFTIRQRLLNGAPGVVASADFGVVGGSLAFLRMTPDDMNALTDPASFYYLSGFINLYTSFGVTLSQNASARAKFGAGMRRIANASVVPGQPGTSDGIKSLGEETNYTPYISLEYLNRGSAETIRAGVEFFDLTVSFFGSLEVIPDILSIEARYLWPVAPKLRQWENPDFLLVTPRLRLTF